MKTLVQSQRYNLLHAAVAFFVFWFAPVGPHLATANPVFSASGLIENKMGSNDISITTIRLARFMIEVKSPEEWRAEIVPLLPLSSPENIIPDRILYCFQPGHNTRVVNFSAEHLTVKNLKPRRSATQTVTNNVDVYNTIFPHWDEWGCTALWMTFCSKNFVKEASKVPSALYTMYPDSHLPAVTGIARVDADEGGPLAGIQQIIVPYHSVYPAGGTSNAVSTPIFEFLTLQRSASAFGKLTTRSRTRFTNVEVDGAGLDHVRAMLVIDVSTTNYVGVQSFTFGNEAPTVSTVRDYRTRTKVGSPINYITTNGIPGTNDARLVAYTKRYEKKEEELLKLSPPSNPRRKQVVVVALVCSAVGFASLVAWVASKRQNIG